MSLNDTIAAISTPRGVGGIAVIRISGDEAVAVARRVFTPCRESEELPPRRALYGSIHTAEGEPVDTGILTYFAAPASYTGEDMAEISCHGGLYVTRAVLSAVLSAGARHAEAGEFTRRAFLAGKLTLTEAEAVGELLEADTEDKMRLAGGALSGRLSRELESITAELTRVMTALYAAIDYPEEDVGTEGEEQIASAVTGARERIDGLLATYKRGRAVSSGVKCVICGRPNAGKSSLYNLIAGEDAAIVTDIPGTTRDVLRQRVSFGGVTLELCDTAGLRDSEDAVEMIGVDRAAREIESAELLICVFDTSAPLSDAERDMIRGYPPVTRIAVLNKGDLAREMSSEEEALIRESHTAVVNMSGITGVGLESLAHAVGELYDAGKCDLGRDAVIWSARQEAELRVAVDYLTAAEEALSLGDAVDAVCTLCEGALAALGETDGRGVTEEIVAGIFSRFCVGK